MFVCARRPEIACGISDKVLLLEVKHGIAPLGSLPCAIPRWGRLVGLETLKRNQLNLVDIHVRRNSVTEIIGSEAASA